MSRPAAPEDDFVTADGLSDELRHPVPVTS